MWAETTTRDRAAAPARARFPHGRIHTQIFQSLTVSAVRRIVSQRAAAAGMDSQRRHDLVVAVSEVATNSVRHADGRGVLRVWQDGQVLVCEVADRGRPDRPLVGRTPPMPGQQGGYGLWIANRLCDHVETLSTGSGTVIRLHMRLAAAPSPC